MENNKTLSEMLDTKRFKIVDSHCHLGPLGTFDIQDSGIDDMVSIMDSLNVEAMCIAPHLGLRLDCKRANDYTFEALTRYPERFIGMGMVNPNREEEITGELERCFDELKMTIIKLHPNESKCPMTRKSYQKVYDFASERSLPILNHDWQSADRVEKLAKKYPNVIFIQAHNGGNWSGKTEDPYFNLANDLDNFYIDICASPICYGSLEKLLDKVSEDKILYGSDTPFLNMAYGLSKVLMADLDDDIKQKILSSNFLKIINRN